MAGIAGTPGASIPTGSPTGRPSYTINPAHVRTLLWLRWKLTLRGYTRSWQRIVGLVFAILFIIPAAFGLAQVGVDG